VTDLTKSPAATQVDLFGPDPTCDACSNVPAAYITDEWDGAWLCRSHLKTYQLKVLSIGISLSAFLRGTHQKEMG
jgi:disulfide oxidoreductase YuzD